MTQSAVPAKPLIQFARVAQELMFGGTLAVVRHGLTYRKGKSVVDVHAALHKAGNPKNGHAKTEMELSALEGYLKQIFFKDRAA